MNVFQGTFKNVQVVISIFHGTSFPFLLANLIWNIFSTSDSLVLVLLISVSTY